MSSGGDYCSRTDRQDRGPLEGRDKGKPVERRRRKAAGLRYARARARPAGPPTHSGVTLSVRLSSAILLASAATLLGCSGDKPVAPSFPKTANLDGHAPSSATCVPGAVGVFVSAYPQTIAAGADRSTFYATVSSGDGGTLSSTSVQWSVSDTNVATIGGPDENGRYYAIGRAAGTTAVTGRCGDLSASATITVEGGSPPAGQSPDAPASVVVSLNTSSLQAGQTTQAGVVGLDAGGQPVDVSSVVWQSSNTAVATVNPTGVVTAVAAGSALRPPPRRPPRSKYRQPRG